MSIAALPELAATRAHDLVGRFATCRMTVVGDVMLDRFVIGRVSRMSPEAPVPVVVFDHEEYRLGFAAFDPARINENDLLAGLAPYLGIGGLLGLNYYGEQGD